MSSLKGYKGFCKGLVCRNKQYAENTVFEEKEPDEMHFYTNPLDVLDAYKWINSDGSFNEFVKVEALEDPKTNNGKRFYTTKLKIGTKLSLPEFIRLGVEFVEKIFTTDSTWIGSSKCSEQIGSCNDLMQISSSGDNTKIASTGNYVHIASSGCSTWIGSSGYAAQISTSGESTQIGSTGDFAKICAAGNGTIIDSTGEDAIICCVGFKAMVKARKGSWITLSEWKYSDEKERDVPVCVRTEYVDGERIKENTFYRLVNGEFKEV